MAAEPPFVPFTTASLIGKYTTDNLPSITFASGATMTGGTQVDTIENGNVVSTTTLASVSTTTLANIVGLSVNVTSSGTYLINAAVPVTTNGTAGVKLGIGGTATATSANLTANFFTASTVASVNTTAINGAGIGSTATVILAQLQGAVVVNAGGTLTLQGAQNVSTTGTASILTNGFLQVSRIS